MTNPNERLPEIEALLRNPEVWRHYGQLSGQLSPELKTDALDAAERLLNALKTNSVIDPLPMRWQAMFGVAMNHVAAGSPLFFSVKLAEAWGASTEGAAAALCPVCSYRAPVSITTCPVCDAVTSAIAAPPPLSVELAAESDLNAVIRKHSPAFWAALRRLADQLGEVRRAWLIGWIEANQNAARIDLASMPIPATLALLHVATGTPLHLTDRLMDAWLQWDPKTDVAECCGCGYRMPPNFPLCVLCLGEIGEPGLWVKMRAVRVSVN